MEISRACQQDTGVTAKKIAKAESMRKAAIRRKTRVRFYAIIVTTSCVADLVDMLFCLYLNESQFER